MCSTWSVFIWPCWTWRLSHASLILSFCAQTETEQKENLLLQCNKIHIWNILEAVFTLTRLSSSPCILYVQAAASAQAKLFISSLSQCTLKSAQQQLEMSLQDSLLIKEQIFFMNFGRQFPSYSMFVFSSITLINDSTKLQLSVD